MTPLAPGRVDFRVRPGPTQLPRLCRNKAFDLTRFNRTPKDFLLDQATSIDTRTAARLRVG